MDQRIVVGIRPTQIRRKLFTKEEDAILIDGVKKFGEDWKSISSLLENRTEKQCKDRFNSYLKPDINYLPWTSEEDELLVYLYRLIGPKWKVMSKYFKGRTYNMIKNHFNYYIIQRRKYDVVNKKYIEKKLEHYEKKNKTLANIEDSFKTEFNNNCNIDDYFLDTTYDVGMTEMFIDL